MASATGRGAVAISACGRTSRSTARVSAATNPACARIASATVPSAPTVSRIRSETVSQASRRVCCTIRTTSRAIPSAASSGVTRRSSAISPVLMPEKLEVKQGRGGTENTKDTRYLAWIAAFEYRVLSDPSYMGDWTEAAKFKGRCLSSCRDMQSVFPELMLVRGGVVNVAWMVDHDSGQPAIDLINPDDGHFWLETEDGLIVDPTRKQFCEGELHYIAFNESLAHTLPTGKCMNCGNHCYEGRTMLCSEECEIDYARYVSSESRSRVTV